LLPEEFAEAREFVALLLLIAALCRIGINAERLCETRIGRRDVFVAMLFREPA
jgi:hypothetical protein